MRILAIWSNKICTNYWAILGAFLWLQLTYDGIASLYDRNSFFIVRTLYELPLPLLFLRLLPFRLIAKPAQAQAKVIKIGICLLPITLGFPVGQQDELFTPRVLQALDQ